MRPVRLAIAVVGALAAAVLVYLAVASTPPPVAPPVQAVPLPAAEPPAAVQPPVAPPPVVAEPAPESAPAPEPAPVELPPVPANPPADEQVASLVPTPLPAPHRPVPRLAPKEPEPKPAMIEKPDIIPAAPPAPQVDPEQTVRNTIRLSMSAFESCYQNSLRRDSRIKGRVVVTVHVQASGLVAAAKLDETTIKDDGVLSCITSRLKAIRFPPLGEDVEVTLPLALVPREN